MTAKSPEHLSKKVLVGYAMGSIGTGIFNTVPSILLLFYMTDILGLRPIMAAAAVVVPKVLAVFTDPLMGALSDRTRSPWGRRSPWLLAGAILLSLSFVFLFRAPAFPDPMARFAWVLCIYAISATSYSVFAVPYVAMPAEMSDDPNERTRIMSWRMCFVVAGVLIGAAGAPAVVQALGSGAKGYGGMSLLLGAITGFAMLTAFFASRSVRQTAAQNGTPGFRAEAAKAIGDPILRHLTAAFIIQVVATSISGAAMPYVATHLLGKNAGFMGGLYLALVLTSFFCIPLWAAISARIGKRRAFVIGALISAGTAMSLVFVHPGYPSWLLIAQFVVSGFGFSGLQVLPFAMLTDVIQHDALMREGRREGLYTGLWTATEKVGLALGPLVTACALALGGYVGGAGQAEPSAALAAILVSVSVVPAALFALSALIISRYPLTESRLAEIRNANREVSPKPA